MALSPALSFERNPIARAEYRHQRFIITTSRSGTGWILLAVAMLLPAFLASVVFFATAFTSTRISVFYDFQFASGWQQALAIGTLLMVTMNVALYLVVVLITVALSANSISREKRSRTWDTLLLTNIDARRIVLGKWWASLRAIWGDHLMILFLRLGLVGFFIHLFNPTPPQGLSVITAYLLPLTLFAVLFTVIDAMFSAALGIAIPLSALSGAVVSGIVLNIKLGTILIAGVLLYVTAQMIHNQPGFDYVPVLAIALGVYVVLTWAMLHLAQIIAVRGQVSPPKAED